MKKPSHQNPESAPDLPALQARQSTNVAYVGLAAAFTATLLNAYLALRYGDWQYTLLLVFSALAAITALLGAAILQKGKATGMWIFVLAGQVALVATGLLVEGMGLISTIAILALTLLVVNLTLTNHHARWAITISILFGVLAATSDWVKPGFQVSATPEFMVGMPAIILPTGLIYAGQLLRAFRHLSIRAQFTTAFIAVSALSIAAATIFTDLNTRRQLTYDANVRLYNAGTQTARLIDDYLKSRVAEVQAQSQLPGIVDILRLDPAILDGSWQQEQATRTLSILSQAAPDDVISYAVLDLHGVDIADSAIRLVGQDESDSVSYKKVIVSGKPFISPVQYSEATAAGEFTIAAPVLDEAGLPIGILRVRYHTRAFDALLKSNTAMLGAGSSAFLLDENGIRLAHGKQPELTFKSITPLPEKLLEQLIAEKRIPAGPADQLSTDFPGLKEAFDSPLNRPFFTTQTESTSIQQGAIVEMHVQPWKVVYALDRSTVLAPIQEQARHTTLLALLIAGLAALGGLLIARLFATPISRLTDAARQVAGGDFTAKASIDAGNELGALATVFNNMAAKLQTNLEGLEGHIAQRSRQLEERAGELRAAAEVGSAIATIRHIDELLPKITGLISERFGFYHVGIFLLDPTGEYAVLSAANSEGGQRMLARQHRLKVGEVGIVGYVTGHKRSRIAMDVGQDAVYFDNPDLADTRSEMALPLVVGERVLGALDVQSTKPGAFAQEDIATLQLLADQVAVAIDNARLFSENQATLEAMQRAYGELSREAWAKILHDQPEFSVLANQYDVLYTPTERWTPEMVAAVQSETLARLDEQTVAIPIQDRGNILGILRLRKPDGHPWSKDELSLVETLAEQLYLALENARLYSETQRRAERERLASSIVAKMRTSNDPQVILQTAVQELRQALLPQSREPLPKSPAPPENGKSKAG